MSIQMALKPQNASENSSEMDSFFVPYCTTYIDDIPGLEHFITSTNLDYIEHYGVKGKSGRYPWGSGDRPYQRLEGGSGISNEAQRAYNRQAKKQAKAREKAEEDKKKQEEKIRKDAQKKEKDRIDNARDPAKLKEHQYEYSPDEVKAALDRFNWEQQLHNYNKQRLQRGAEYMQVMLKYATTAIAAYNVGANIYNSVSGDNKYVPLISTGAGEQKKKPKKPEKPKEKKE